MTATGADTTSSSSSLKGVAAAAAAAASSGGDGNSITDVTIHPLVLLSAADHYHRVARGTRKRVVGVLLGQIHKGGRVDATNSFAVPFEEDSRNPAVFYLDHNYLENMLGMFRKVSAKERVVGFYSTGPAIRPNDLRIHDVVQRFTHVGLATAAATTAGSSASTAAAAASDAATSPTTDDSNAMSMMMTQPPAVFCIIDVRPDRPDLPVTAYKVVEQVNSSGGSSGSSSVAMKSGGSGGVERSFAHVPSQMGAIEAEEVGVEHLLRDINDPTISTVASLIQGKLSGLATLTEKLLECQDYLETILASQQMKSQSKNPKKAHPQILANLQTILALLPNLNQPDLVRSIMVKTNDMLASIYLASIIRSVIALHDLVNNKIRYGEDGTELKDSDDDDDEEKKMDAEKENKAKKDPGDEKKKDAEMDDKKDAKKK